MLTLLPFFEGKTRSGLSYSIGSAVKPAVYFHAKESLEKLEQDQHEEAGSDYECDELPDPNEAPRSHQIEEVSSDCELSEPGHPPTTRKVRNKIKYRQKRAAARLGEQHAGGTTLKAVALKKRSASTAQGLPLDMRYQQDFTPSKPAWKGMPDIKKDKTNHSLEELVNCYGMEVFPWDGR